MTRIVDQMVAGKSIDQSVVASIISDIDLAIAHNARFGRPMVERLWVCFTEKPWAWTFDGVEWLQEGKTVGKLDCFGMQFGWFYEEHRALADCEARLALRA